MTPEVRVPPLRWGLPLAQLFVCAVLLWPLRPMLVSQVQSSLKAYGVVRDTVDRGIGAPRRLIPFDLSNPELRRRIKRMELREWTVATLDLPGGLPDFLYAVVSPAHAEWTPKGMLMWTWRDLSWPVAGMFCWWLAGRGIEALLYARQKIIRPRIGWWEALLSLPVLAFGGTMAVLPCVEQSTREGSPWFLLVVFGIMWFALGTSTVAAWIVQWRLRRRLASGTIEEATTLASGS
jgi:hypothetical protein